MIDHDVGVTTISLYPMKKVYLNILTMTFNSSSGFTPKLFEPEIGIRRNGNVFTSYKTSENHFEKYRSVIDLSDVSSLDLPQQENIFLSRALAVFALESQLEIDPAKASEFILMDLMITVLI